MSDQGTLMIWSDIWQVLVGICAMIKCYLQPCYNSKQIYKILGEDNASQEAKDPIHKIKRKKFPFVPQREFAHESS